MSDIITLENEEQEQLAQADEEQQEEAAAAADEAASKACLDYVASVALKHAPSSQQEYLQQDSNTFLLPNPIRAQQRAAAAGDRELAIGPYRAALC